MDIYLTSIRELPEMPADALLAEEHLRGSAGYCAHGNRARFAAAILLMRHALGDQALVEIELEEHGKPYLRKGPYFNISSTEKYAVIAVSGYGHVGVDIEEIRPPEPEEAGSVLNEQELEWLASRSGTGQAFSSLLTAKEAARKAAGLDSELDRTSFSILPVSREWHIALNGSWFLNWRRIDGHMLCVCGMRPEPLRIHVLSLTGAGNPASHLLTPRAADNMRRQTGKNAFRNISHVCPRISDKLGSGTPA